MTDNNEDVADDHDDVLALSDKEELMFHFGLLGSRVILRFAETAPEFSTRVIFSKIST